MIQRGCNDKAQVSGCTQEQRSILSAHSVMPRPVGAAVDMEITVLPHDSFFS
jgi:hypothetical protein